MWAVGAKAALIWRFFGRDALDVYLTDLEMKWLGPRSRLRKGQKARARALLVRIRRRHGLDVKNQDLEG
jgi:hypothetical protein